MPPLLNSQEMKNFLSSKFKGALINLNVVKICIYSTVLHRKDKSTSKLHIFIPIPSPNPKAAVD